MNRDLASSTSILFLFLSIISFSSARVPFHFDIDIHDPHSFPTEKPESQPATLIRWEPDSEASSEPKILSFEPRIPGRPLPFSSQSHLCHHYKPWIPRRQSDDIRDTMARVGVRHLARGWTRFGHIQPIFSRQHGMVRERRDLLRRLYHRHQHIKDTGFITKIRKFLNHL